MSTAMSACACMGPAGDCPCIRRSKGLPVPITESFVSPQAWDYLTDKEKIAINEMKIGAAMRMIFDRKPQN